jgi:hypothetical protein
MTNFTILSNKELSEAIDFHRRQRNMSRGVNESAHARQTQVVRLLEAEEARRLDEVADKKWDESKEKWVSVKRPTFDPKKERGRASTPDQGQKRSDFDEEADLTKIDTKRLQSMVQMHKHYGQKDPASKAAAERGEAELKNRMKKEEVESLDDKMWKVSYDHGPHQSNTIKVKAKSQSHAWEVAKEVANKKYGHARITSGSVTPVKEEVELDEGHYHVSWSPNLSHTVMNAKSAEHAVASAKAHLIKKIPKLADEKYSDTFDKKPRVTNITNESMMSFNGFRSKDLE